MKTILITAFEPFGGKETNASAEALRSLPDQIGGYDVQKQLLPVVFGKAAESVRDDYDFIFLLGEAARKTVTPETRARNIRAARIPDNEGNQPENGKIISDGPEEYRTMLPVRETVEKMTEEGYRITVSDDAGAFVCNDTFYLVGTGSKAPVGFIHVPVIRMDGIAETVCRFIELAVSHESGGRDGR